MGSETLHLNFPELSPDAFAYSKRKLEVQGEVPFPCSPTDTETVQKQMFLSPLKLVQHPEFKWEFPKIRGTLFGFFIIRILLFRVLY